MTNGIHGNPSTGRCILDGIEDQIVEGPLHLKDIKTRQRTMLLPCRGVQGQLLRGCQLPMTTASAIAASTPVLMCLRVIAPSSF